MKDAGTHLEELEIHIQQLLCNGRLRGMQLRLVEHTYTPIPIELMRMDYKYTILKLRALRCLGILHELRDLHVGERWMGTEKQHAHIERPEA
jgi:hypothetical protein